jgi:hypothetical protein
VIDYETGPIPGNYAIAVIYDALHHAEDPGAVVRNVYHALDDGGMLITMEPGTGHSTSEESVAVMAKYGTTEKDMPFSLQYRLMREAGFSAVEQYTRVSQLPTEDISAVAGAFKQLRHAFSLAYGSASGLTSVVVGRKMAGVKLAADAQSAAQSLLDATRAHDEFVQRRR